MIHNLRIPQKLALLVGVMLGALVAASAYGLSMLRQSQAGADAMREATILYAAIAVVAGLVGLYIARSIQLHVLIPVRRAAAAARSIADGDLTREVEVVGRGELARMLTALGEMTLQLRGLVGEVVASAHSVADTSSQLAQGNLELSQRTEEQASTLQQTSASLEDLTTTVGRNAQNARQAARLAGDASEVARRGGTVVGEVVSTMTDISLASRRIEDIIGVIDGIAFQTNILALNAAVEAARAGEQGRGFAVVAAEVRSLAQRSATASREIKALIGDSAGKVEAGTRLVDAAGQTMEQIVQAVTEVTQLITQIATASEEQSSGIEQVHLAMTQMDQVVQQNASLVEEAAAATESLKDRSNSLLQLVARFRLGAGAAPGQAALAPAAVRTRPEPRRLAERAPGLLAGTAAAPAGAWKEF